MPLDDCWYIDNDGVDCRCVDDDGIMSLKNMDEDKPELEPNKPMELEDSGSPHETVKAGI